LKIELFSDINDSQDEMACVYWTIEIASIRGNVNECAGYMLDIVADTTMPPFGNTDLRWTYDGLTYWADFEEPNAGISTGSVIDTHKFRHRFRFDHFDGQELFRLPTGTRYCPESFNQHPEL